jgi:hypothetical protein
VILAGIAVLLLVHAAGPAWAQQSAPPADAVVLDYPALLSSTNLVTQQVTDPVWEVQTPQGRVLVMLPLAVGDIQTPVTLEASPVDLRGGRFIGFLIPSNTSGRGGATELDPAAMNQSELPEVLRQQFEAASASRDQRGSPQPAAPAQQQAPDSPFGGLDLSAFDEPASDDGPAGGAGQVSSDAPRLTRAVTLLPGDRLRWEVDRAIPGAEIRDGQQPYMLLLRGDRLRELEPDRPEITQRGDNEDPRAFLQRRREAERQYREQVAQFRDTRREVMDLPMELEAPGDRLMAVYQVIGDGSSLEVAEPGSGIQGVLRPEQLQTMRQISGAGEGLVNAVRLASGGSVLDQRLAATALYSSNVMNQMRTGDPVYQAVRTLVNAEDPYTRRVALLGVVQSQPITRATATLLTEAASDLGPRARLTALRGLMTVESQADGGRGGNGAGRAMVMQTAAGALRDPAGPATRDVLEALYETLDRTVVHSPTGDAAVGRGGTELDADDPSTQALIAGLPLDLPPDRLEGVLRFVLRQASAGDGLAGAWLDQRLLSEQAGPVMDQTLDLLAGAQQAQLASPGGAIDAMSLLDAARQGGIDPESLSGVVTSPEQLEDDAPDQADAGVAGGEPEAAAAGEVQLLGLIPIRGADHRLLQLLDAQGESRQLAWRSLRHFRLDVAGGRFGGGDRAEAELTPLQQIVRSGVAAEPTPEGLVPFLLAQQRTQRTEGLGVALLEVVLRGDDTAATAAAQAMTQGDVQTLSRAWNEKSAAQRGRLASRLYELAQREAPLPAQLLRSEQQPGAMNQWFVERVVQGELPEAIDFVERVGDDRQMLQLAQSPDPEVAAAAAATLAASAGGDRREQSRLADEFARFRTQPEQLEQAWTDARQRIHLQRLADAAGSYALEAAVARRFDSSGRMLPPGQQPDVDDPALPFTPLGFVEMSVRDGQVQLGLPSVTVSVPEDRLALRIDDPASLKQLDAQGQVLGDLPLEGAEPLELLPREDGSWRGDIGATDGRRLVVRLVPQD